MKPILDKYNLKVVTTHRAFDDFKKDINEIISYNKTLGCDLCGVSIMPKYCYESEEALNQFIKDANDCVIIRQVEVIECNKCNNKGE
jgi:copper homeostasis protein CutC